jgi:hypothetical protein
MIWRLVATDIQQFVGEERDTKTKRLSFFCVDRQTGHALWENKTYGEQWWMGIEAVYKDVLYLHRFATPDMPQHKGITTVDLVTGRELWTRQDLRFVDVRDSTLRGSTDSLEGTRLVTMHYRAGVPVPTNAIDEGAGKEERNGAGTDMLFPIPRENLSGTIVQRHVHEDRVGPVEVLETDTMVIFNYHKPASPQQRDPLRLDNILQVVEKQSGAVVYTDMVNKGVPGIVPEAFFVTQGMLYYVKDRTVLTAVRLTAHAPAA